MRNKVLRTFAVAVILISGGALIFNAGANYGIQKGRVIVVEGLENIEPQKVEAADFSLFWEAWDELKKFHLRGDEVSNKDFIYGAIDGLAKSLEDDYTFFLNPSDAQKFNEDISGNFSGIGAEIGIREKRLIIISPLKNSPAERAGIKSGDHILQIDGKPSDGLSLNESVKRIRGERGSVVTLLILRDEFSEPKEFKITREDILVPTIDWEIKEGGIMHIQLYKFNINTESAFYSAMISGLQRGIRGIVLDLRNNPGGYLEMSVSLAGWFLERGELVVAEESRTGERIEFYARGNEVLKRVPVVVLVNEGSASASEILAGALRDQREVKLVGEKTFGKGTVQQLKDLSDGSIIKMTVAHWLLPSGQLIEGNGLTPDYEVEFEELENGADVQFEKAMEILREEIASSRTIFLL